MKLFRSVLLAFAGSLLAAAACPAQQPASPTPSPALPPNLRAQVGLREDPRSPGKPAPTAILLVYVQNNTSVSLIPKIALGLVQPALRITAFAKCAQVTDGKTDKKFAGLAVQLKPEDAKVLAAALTDKNSADSGPNAPVWFANSNNKLLGFMDKDLVKREIADDGVLMFFLDDEEPIYSYLTLIVKAE